MTLRKNVAGQFVYFVLIDASSGGALTGATVTAKLSIDGAAQAACTGSIVEDGNGQYHLSASQADTNGNDIGYLFTATGAIPVSVFIATTAADPTNATSLGLTDLDAAISSRLASASAPSNFSALGITGAGKISEVVLADTLTTYTGNTPQTGDSFVRLGAPSGASVSADIAAIQAEFPVNLSGLIYIRKNQALSAFMFPLFATNGSPVTGATVTAMRSIDGATFGACTNLVSEISNGWYKINLSAADLNGVTIALKFSATGAQDTDIVIITQP